MDFYTYSKYKNIHLKSAFYDQKLKKAVSHVGPLSYLLLISEIPLKYNLRQIQLIRSKFLLFNFVESWRRRT